MLCTDRLPYPKQNENKLMRAPICISVLLKDLVHDIISNLCHLTIDSCNSDEMSSYIIVFLFSIFISSKRVLTTVGFSVLAQDGPTFSFILLLIICGHTK